MSPTDPCVCAHTPLVPPGAGALTHRPGNSKSACAHTQETIRYFRAIVATHSRGNSRNRPHSLLVSEVRVSGNGMHESRARMERSRCSDADSTDRGIPLPATMEGSMGQKSPFDDVRVEKSRQPATNFTAETTPSEQQTDQLEPCRSLNDYKSSAVGSRPLRPKQLELLGETSSSAGEPVCPEIGDLEELRPCDLTRLLNSTDLGPVINDRQLYRHRSRAGFRIGKSSRISLPQYVAWLLEERSTPPRSRRNAQRRRRERMTKDPGCCFVSVPEILDLLQKQRFLCALSGRELTPSSAVLDHIIPVARGGEHRIENAQVLDAEVNRAKGTLTNDEFLELCRQITATRAHGGVE